ncbi:MAG TPA: hypothetical protein VGA88_13310 [Burkholderiales bacterium]
MWVRHAVCAVTNAALLQTGARARGLRSIEGEVLAENVGMLALAQRQGFRLVRSPESAQTIRVVLDL